jgi:bifunctional oligoribonuclease and PAP phosphatase NrnA
VAWQETEGLIEVLRSVGTAQVAMIAKEQSDGVWKVSLRSRGDVNVGRVARALGGGGHAFLAGLVSKADLTDLVERISASIIASGTNSDAPTAGGSSGDHSTASTQAPPSWLKVDE